MVSGRRRARRWARKRNERTSDMIHIGRPKLLIGVALASTVVAGCGGGGNASTSSTPTPPSATPTAPSATASTTATGKGNKAERTATPGTTATPVKTGKGKLDKKAPTTADPGAVSVRVRISSGGIAVAKKSIPVSRPLRLLITAQGKKYSVSVTAAGKPVGAAIVKSGKSPVELQVRPLKKGALTLKAGKLTKRVPIR